MHCQHAPAKGVTFRLRTEAAQSSTTIAFPPCLGKPHSLLCFHWRSTVTIARIAVTRSTVAAALTFRASSVPAFDTVATFCGLVCVHLLHKGRQRVALEHRERLLLANDCNRNVALGYLALLLRRLRQRTPFNAPQMVRERPCKSPNDWSSFSDCDKMLKLRN
jgi:hypothetical protein